MLTHSVAVYPSTLALQFQAATLAKHLNLPLVLHHEHPYEYLLVLTPHSLGLKKAGESALPLIINFHSKKMAHRLQHISLKKEALARAMGLKNNQLQTRIIDATGGLGRDSFIIASLGFQVELLERSPIIFALLSDGIRRGKNVPFLCPILDRLRLRQTDAISWLPSLKGLLRPHIIYLDPMFPPRRHTALPKKEMIIFQAIIGEDADAEALLATALACALTRVVVKRPRLAPSLSATTAPTYSLTGRSSRFDVYLIS